MSLLKDIKTLIPISAAPQDSIFLGDYPDSPDNMIAMYQNSGRNPEHTYSKREFEQPSLQFLIRNTSYADMIAAAETIKDTLDGLTEQIINGNRYISIFQSGDIIAGGKDLKNRSTCSLNFDVRVERG